MHEKDDIKFMQRCIDLAAGARGLTRPNPVVGAVVVCQGRIIGEGFHVKAGGPHAEVIAINSVRDKSLLPGSELYVSLEPCSHHGKTPPCTDLIISSGIPVVYAGTRDTSAKVSGRGFEKLRSAGVKVTESMLEDECRWINRRFFTFHEKKRPWIILKWAESADGFIDTDRPKNSGTGPYWITGKPERVLVHKWRAEEESILVGAVTARTDNPKLNVRHWAGESPLKLILSHSANVGESLTNSETNGTVVVFSDKEPENKDNRETVILDKQRPSADTVCEFLYQRGIQSLFIEGGAEILNHFIGCGLWDEARVFTGMVNFGNGLKAPRLKNEIISEISFSNSTLKTIVNDFR